MVTLQDALTSAVKYAHEVLGNYDFTFEEVERDRYKDQDVWCITLGFPKRTLSPTEANRFPISWPREYKTFLINANSGEAMAMKIRELAS
jgi:hypothetical protein